MNPNGWVNPNLRLFAPPPQDPFGPPPAYAPHAGDFALGAPRVCRSVNELNQLEFKLCDDIIRMILAKNLHANPHIVDDNRRRGFWQKVFDSWTSEHSVQDAEREIPDRTGNGWLTHVGFVTDDMIPERGTPKHRRANRGFMPPNQLNQQAQPPAQVVVPPNRRRGALVFMKGSLHTDEGKPRVYYCDAAHLRIASRYVRLKPGMTDAEAQARTIDNFDRQERDRVFDYNMALGVDFAQTRLKRKLMSDAGMDIHVLNERVPHNENFAAFYQLERLRGSLMRYAQMVTNICNMVGPLEPKGF